MLTDLPTDLHLLILEHDTEKQHLRSENQRLMNNYRDMMEKVLGLQDRLIFYQKLLAEAHEAIPWENNADDNEP